MKRVLFTLLAALTIGCSSKVTGPTDVPAGRVPVVAATAPIAKASTKSVTFDPSQLGMVTITNDTGASQNYVFIVWDATDEVNQVNAAQAYVRLAAGETRVVTVGLTMQCGVRYQRDVYVGPDGSTRYTMSDLGNYEFYAVGSYWPVEQCDVIVPPTVPTVPPVIDEPPARCTNPEANNYGGLLPCEFSEGVIEEPPNDVCNNLPSVQTVVPEGYHQVGQSCQPDEHVPPPPQNFLYCHVAVNITGGKNPKTIVHETQVGGLNGIPLTAIVNGHSVGTQNGVTTEHLFDYYGVCDGRGIGPQ